METFIEQAKIMPKGQITVPKEIRKLLGLNVGDHVSFVVDKGRVMFCNSTLCAMTIIQNEMNTEAQKLGIKTEEDVVNLIKDCRK